MSGVATRSQVFRYDVCVARGGSGAAGLKSAAWAPAGLEPLGAMSTPPLAPGGMASGPFGGPQAQQAAREVNTATLCRIGQETVQDIVYRTMEIFQLLRNMQVGAWSESCCRGHSPGDLRVPESPLHPSSSSGVCPLPWETSGVGVPPPPYSCPGKPRWRSPCPPT